MYKIKSKLTHHLLEVFAMTARPGTFSSINFTLLARVLRNVVQKWQAYSVAADKPPRVHIEQLKQTN